MSDVEYEDPGQEIAVRDAAPAPTLFGTTDPAEVIVRATAAAQPLAEVVRKQKLVTTISGREHVRVEGWTLLGSMLGVFPVVVWTRELEDGWEARVEARTRDGAIVGAAEAMCLRAESKWKTRDGYALRSMAQTRATSKAMRGPLGFVMQLAGFDPTPAEEMPAQEPQAAASRPAVPRGDRMRLRVQELAQEADKARGKDAGATWAEVCDAITWRHEQEPEFGATWDALSEGDVEWLGTELGAWIAAAVELSFLDWVAVPF